MGWKSGHARGNNVSKGPEAGGTPRFRGIQGRLGSRKGVCDEAENVGKGKLHEKWVFLLGVIRSHWRIFSEVVAWSDANFNAAGWGSDPFNPLALLILSLAGRLLFNSNMSKIFHGRQSLVARGQFVDLLGTPFWRMRRSRGKGTSPSSSKRWRPHEDAVGKGRRVEYHGGLSTWTFKLNSTLTESCF